MNFLLSEKKDDFLSETKDEYYGRNVTWTTINYLIGSQCALFKFGA